jgi:hypothetical protein
MSGFEIICEIEPPTRYREVAMRLEAEFRA